MDLGGAGGFASLVDFERVTGATSGMGKSGKEGGRVGRGGGKRKHSKGGETGPERGWLLWRPTHADKEEVRLDPVATLLELVLHAHHEQRVESVDDGRPERRLAEHAGRVADTADRLQLVGAPRVLRVAVPRKLHHLKRSAQRQRCQPRVGHSVV